MDIFGLMVFLRIFDCTEFQYQYLSITVEPPECFAAERL